MLAAAPYILAAIGVVGIFAAAAAFYFVRATLAAQRELGAAAEREAAAIRETRAAQKAAADTRRAMEIRQDAASKPFSDIVDDL